MALAPAAIRELFSEFLIAGELLSVTAEALDLLSAYEVRGILGPRFRNDMLHIAVATVAEVDVLVSWNFKHIVNLGRIRLFNAVSLEMGYRPIEIRSPKEILFNEQGL